MECRDLGTQHRCADGVARMAHLPALSRVFHSVFTSRAMFERDANRLCQMKGRRCVEFLMHEGLKKADFEPYLSQRFEVHIEGFVPVEVELAEIQDRSTNFMESFSLFFRGAKDRVFRQNTYRMTHPEMGEFSLFLGQVTM